MLLCATSLSSLPWFSLLIRPSYPSLPPGLPNDILCPCRADVNVLVGRLTIARLLVRFHRRTLVMSSSLLLQHCPPCLVHLTLMICEMGDRWPYSCCFVDVATRICSKMIAAFLCNFQLAFSPSVLLTSM